ncbi:2-keto-4-pentenoate hydratase [Delftia sp. PS-11]|uniref:2-keto-4-pentenoate hydratase n=1 Tax=Delftia sp. PS-11 TaxID=2767222 RepID=UPI002457EAB9|nr:fumarylacetoacetate hydrolase family protein [Delftia sp. PS-11]KAJ8742268.1 fumarylacetoacetate hydrolase family protein [Delftia sp. PS-11]
MNSDNKLKDAALALRQARMHRRTIARVSETFAIHGADQAYQVSRLNTDADVAQGRRISGKKIGLTSKAVQQQLGVDQPDYGVLFADMELLDGQELETSRLLQPKAEGEVAFVMGRDLDAEHLTWAQFLRGIEYLLPAIEIVDSAIDGWKITLEDTIADNASCGLYVLGLEPRRLADVCLAGLGMDLRRNGHTASVGSGAACLGNPLLAVHWLARTMAARGEPLKAGDVVLSGALGPMVPLHQGDAIDLEIAGLGRVRTQAV